MEQANVTPAAEQPELDEAQKANKKLKRRQRGVKTYQRFFLEAFIFVLMIWVLLFVIIGISQMPNGDMSPKIASTDIVLYYRLDKEVKYQDVVVYQKADSNGRKATLVSRVVGAPGDTVTFTEDGVLIVNGNAVSEPEIYYRGTVFVGDTAPEYPIVLGEDECFVLGDRRDQAYDSRAFGPVKTSEILGTAIMVLRRFAL